MCTKLAKNIQKLYILKIFYALCFCIPVLVLFRQDNGLTLTQIMILQSMYAIMLMVLEVPSGYFADRWGRKTAILVAAILRFAGNAVIAAGTTFWMFLIAELMFAIGTSAMSGADSSFLFDTLKDLKQEKKYTKVRGHTNFLFLGTMALAQIAGGLIATYGLPRDIASIQSIDNLRLTVIVSLPFLVVPIFVALSLYEPAHHKRVVKKGYFKDMQGVIQEEVLDNKNLLRVMVLFMLLGSGLQYALWFYQPYFEMVNIDIFWFGFIFGGFQIFSALVSKVAHRIEQKLGIPLLIAVCIGLLVSSYTGMALVGVRRGVVFCFFQQFVRGIYQIVVSDYIHQRISASYRATIQSIQSLGKNLIYAILLPLRGWVADVYTLDTAFFIIALTLTVVLVPLFLRVISYKILRKKRKFLYPSFQENREKNKKT